MSQVQEGILPGGASPSVEPYIPDSKNLPELTPKALILGVILAVVLAGSNAYLGLKIGQTVAASIPAAVLSMAILRLFRTSNILENNIVQTVASAGEVIAAATIFTLPALVMIGYWSSFPVIETCAIAAIGGLLGVLFSVPLRRALMIEGKLIFPEGVATGEILKAGESKGSGAQYLISGGAIAAIIQLGQSAWQVLSSSVHHWFYLGNTVVGFGCGNSLVMVGAGYIVGLQVGACIMTGAIITYIISIPLYGYMFGVADLADPLKSMLQIKSEVRLVAVGTMAMAGLLTLGSLVAPIRSAIQSSFKAMRDTRLSTHKAPRTERDIPMTWVLGLSLFLVPPLVALLWFVMSGQGYDISTGLFVSILAISAVAALFLGFLAASISGYMAGLVGTSSNPLSGVLIGVILIVSMIFLGVFGLEIDFAIDTGAALSAAALTIIIASVVACIGVVSCDNLQDLKSGQVVGATPWKQQVSLMVGVLASAIVIAFVMQLLYDAYGMGESFPREGMDPTQSLSAPQATLMASIAQGVFAHNLSIPMMLIGACIAVVGFFVNRHLKKTKSFWSLPPLGLALGMYLPLDVTVPIFLGGLVSYMAANAREKRRASMGAKFDGFNEKTIRHGILLASGFIAGDALVGIFLAIPFSIHQSTDVFRYVPDVLTPWTSLMGLAALLIGSFFLYRTSTRAR